MTRTSQAKDLQPGDLIALDFEHIGIRTIRKALIVVDVQPTPEIDAPDDRGYVYLHAQPTSGTATKHYRLPAAHRVTLLAEHHPVCAHCGGLWPCRPAAIDETADSETRHVAMACVVCGKTGGDRWAEIRVETPEGVTTARYHTRKGSPCRKAYLRAAAKDPEALERLRAEDNGLPYRPAPSYQN